jgi:hypothetical protein
VIHLDDCITSVQGALSGKVDKLVEEDFLTLPARVDGFSQPSYAVGIGHGALQEATISSKDISHTILGCAIEFWPELVIDQLQR